MINVKRFFIVVCSFFDVLINSFLIGSYVALLYIICVFKLKEPPVEVFVTLIYFKECLLVSSE